MTSTASLRNRLFAGVRIDDRYQVLAHIGSGAMGVVLEARDLRLRRAVAIKLLAGAMAENEQARRLFYAEARAMARLSHPNVVQIYDYGEHEGHPYIVMERVPGETLAEAVQRGALPVDVAIGVLRQVGSGLDAVHAVGVVHRDVKLDNMIVGPGYRACLTDFGVSAVQSSAIDAALETDEAEDDVIVVGSPAYMAPEVVTRAHRPKELRYLRDVYALGICAYELFTGDSPFTADTVEQLLAAHVDQSPALPSERCDDLPRGFDHVLLRALAKNPRDRYRSARDFVAELQAMRDEWARDFGPSARRLLYADHEPEMRTLTATALEAAYSNAVVDGAETGDDALALARLTTYDLAIVDLELEGLDGFTLCECLRELSPTMALLVTSNALDPPARLRLAELGVNATIEKPTTPRELIAATSHLLGDETPPTTPRPRRGR